RIGDQSVLELADGIGESRRTLPIDHAPDEFAAQRLGLGIEAAAPVGMRGCALLADVAPRLQYIVGNLKRPVIPTQRLLRARQLIGAERLAMGLGCTRLVRLAVTDG